MFFRTSSANGSEPHHCVELHRSRVVMALVQAPTTGGIHKRKPKPTKKKAKQTQYSPDELERALTPLIISFVPSCCVEQASGPTCGARSPVGNLKAQSKKESLNQFHYVYTHAGYARPRARTVQFRTVQFSRGRGGGSGGCANPLEVR